MRIVKDDRTKRDRDCNADGVQRQQLFLETISSTNELYAKAIPQQGAVTETEVSSPTGWAAATTYSGNSSRAADSAYSGMWR